MKKILLIAIFITVWFSAFSQISNLSLGDPYEDYRDSIKTSDYPWRLPIMGGKLRDMGFDLPYPNGISVTYGYSSQQLTLNNLNVGFDPNNLTNVDGLARFRSIKANVNAVIARYDFYVLPFINFFGIAGHIESDTQVELGLPFDLKFSTQNAGTTIGWGTVVAGGIGPMVMAANFVQTWTFVPSLEKPSNTIVLDGRVGYMHRFPKHPEQNIVFLVGAQYLGLNPLSSGNADLEKLVGITPEGKKEAAEKLDNWYEGLDDPEKNVFGGVYQGLSNYLNNSEAGKIYYEFEKSLYYPVSMTAGFNYQLNHRFQFNAIYTFLGSRQQIVGGVTYRFGFRGKNLLRGLTL
ncbi:hypothetical protein [Algoriphagus halophilus]|uniref:Type IX secretion system membrane protein PorP/SprF n=1 Tax=Algoriphagus halophilus TaxID=226505 RepID=A0A1N6DQY9_9BACT|nr:hypothetical protein [Algoriphagus halophilus]SIN73186.1 hypothetical protein SAMN05444394_1281 [Algoriphagus halophilus]